MKSRIAWVFLTLVIAFAIAGPLVRHSPLDRIGTPFLPPGSLAWLGTDEQGRDIFARLAQGARVSLSIGLGVQLISLVTGITIGVLGVYAPVWLRTALMRFTDGMFAFPDILLAILIIGIWGFGIVPVVAALAITSWPSVVRLVRAQVASLKDREFIVASRALGTPQWQVVMRHVLPQLTGIILAVSMVDLAGIILAESALSFLGIGVQAPTASWGSMINNARQEMLNPEHRMVLVWPCVLLSLTIFALNFVGDDLRARFDPKNRSRSA